MFALVDVCTVRVQAGCLREDHFFFVPATLIFGSDSIKPSPFDHAFGEKQLN